MGKGSPHAARGPRIRVGWRFRLVIEPEIQDPLFFDFLPMRYTGISPSPSPTTCAGFMHRHVTFAGF